MPFIKLDPARIRREALRLFRDDGLDGVGMRRLAASLGVSPSSLYWHVPDRQALHRMLAEDIFRACLAAVPEVGQWDGWLRAFGMILWDAQQTMPDTRRLIMSTAAASDSKLAMSRDVVAMLEGRGIKAGVMLPGGGDGGGIAALPALASQLC